MRGEHGRIDIGREPIVSYEPAELDLSEDRSEDPADRVPTPVERQAHERPEEVSVAGIHERRVPLGGHHKTSLDLRLRIKGIGRQLEARG